MDVHEQNERNHEAHKAYRLRMATIELADAVEVLVPSPAALPHASKEWKRIYQALETLRAELSTTGQVAPHVVE